MHLEDKHWNGIPLWLQSIIEPAHSELRLRQVPGMTSGFRTLKRLLRLMTARREPQVPGKPEGPPDARNGFRGIAPLVQMTGEHRTKMARIQGCADARRFEQGERSRKAGRLLLGRRRRRPARAAREMLLDSLRQSWRCDPNE